MPEALLQPSRIGAPGSLNMTTPPGRAIPAFKHFLLNTDDRLHYYVGAIEYKSPSGATTGAAPRQYAGVNKSIFRLDNGALTSDTTFNDVVQGMVICDGPTAGTAVLLVTFGTGNPTAAQTGVFYRSLTTDTTPWTDASAADTTKLTAWQIIKAGPDLYAATDAGRASSLGDYRVSKCPAGNNPTLAASWGNGVEVGTPEWNITNLAAIGQSPVAGKPDGLYYYDQITRRYENVLKHYELAPHALNGKVTASVTNGVIYTTHDGRAFFFDGVAVQEVSPHKFWPILSKDIGNSRITAVADAGDVIYMYTELAHQTTQNAGLIVNTVTAAGAATAITTNMVDGSMATGGDVSSLASTSFIDVWADIPFEGVVMHVTRLDNTTATAVFGSVSYSSANDTFTADANGFWDGTRLSGNGSLSYVAFPPSASAGLVAGKSPNFGALMQKVDFNYSSGTDVSQKYGMRIAMSGAAFPTTTEIDELEIIPYRAGMPNSTGGIYTAANNFTNRDRAGLIGHVYAVKRERTTGFVPHDAFAINSGPGVWAMAMHNGRLGQASAGQNLGPSLIGWGRYSTWAVSMGITRDEARTRYPLLADISTTTPGPLLQLCHDWSGKPDEWEQFKTLDRIKINTWNVQPTDKTEVFAQFDNRDIVSLGVYVGGPLDIVVNQGAFRTLNLWLGFDDAASTDETAPQFIEPYILEYTLLGTFPPQDPATATPVLT